MNQNNWQQDGSLLKKEHEYGNKEKICESQVYDRTREVKKRACVHSVSML
jgi:hypothetical protein